MPIDIYVIGAGLCAAEDITLSGLRCIRRSRRVFYLGLGAPQGLAELLEELRIPGTDICATAGFGARRKDSYRQMIEPILAAAAAEPPVAWVCDGTPGYVDGISSLLAQIGPERGLSLEVVPGVSSFDAVLGICNLVEHVTCVQAISAPQLLLSNLRPDPSMGCVLVQLSRAETTLEIGNYLPKPRAFERLAQTLIDSYGADREALLVTIRRSPQALSKIEPVHFSGLPEAHAAIGPFSSLFISPDTSRRVEHADIRRQLESYEHMERCYLTPLEMLARGQ